MKIYVIIEFGVSISGFKVYDGFWVWVKHFENIDFGFNCFQYY